MAESPGEMTLRDHLTELRRRLFISAIGVLVGTIIAFIFHRQILLFLMQPAKAINAIPGDTPLIYTMVTEMLGITMKVSLLGGFILSVPLWTYQLVMFISPGLKPRERKYLFVFLPGVTAAFLTGTAFSYYVLIPPALQFLLTFNSDIAAPMIRIGSYMNLMITLLFWMGVIFETPVLMFVLARLRVIRYKTFARWRRLAIVLAFVLGALITPTFDPINQSLVAGPIIVLYEIGIWLAWLAGRGEKQSTTDIAQAGESEP
ncbi:MAG: twin-arginine translocase subunit TatC [Chloroflexi bacterium]|nr:twin-arginine translocase subunit TatC [Chloroflexota bacterium]